MKISKKALTLISLFIPSFIYVSLIGLYSYYNYGVYSSETLLRIIRIILMIVGIDIFITRFINSKKELFQIIFFSLLFHSILMIAMFINSSLRELIYSITGAYEIVNDTYPFVAGLRISGLTYGLAITSVLQSYLCLFVFYNPLKLNVIFRIFVLIISLVTMFISGKSGFIILGLMLLYYLLSSETKFNRKLKFIIPTVIVFSLLLSFEIFLPNSDLEWLVSSNSELINLIERGSSKTTESLSDMYFFPEGMNMIFGYGTGNRFIFTDYLDIDPGFVRWVWGFGIIGSILLFLPFFRIIKDTIRLKNSILLLIVTSLLILHFKEDTLYVRVNFYLLIMIYFACFKYSRKKSEIVE